jgi:hypothetical protein
MYCDFVKSPVFLAIQNAQNERYASKDPHLFYILQTLHHRGVEKKEVEKLRN